MIKYAGGSGGLHFGGSVHAQLLLYYSLIGRKQRARQSTGNEFPENAKQMTGKNCKPYNVIYSR